MKKIVSDEVNKAIDIPSKYVESAILRYMVRIDKKRRVVLPKAIVDPTNAEEFYIELHEDCIKLIPIIKKERGE